MEDLHRYAVDEQGNTIYIKDVTLETRHNKFYCMNCDGEMIPVLGQEREWHFRHKVDTPSCSYESYIHKIGKEKLKERFYNQETFPVSYFIEYTCTKSNKCPFKEKLPNQKCNKRDKRTIDLKQIYDTCEEEKTYKGYRADLMLTHSKHPEQEPLFIEIAYKHDCNQKKLASDIQIIEVKVNSDKDFKMSFNERELMYMDFSSNDPYIYGDKPPVRFYSFPRQADYSISLSRFIVFKTEKGTTEGLVLPQKVSCQEYEPYQSPIVYYELATSEEILKHEKRENLYAFGMAMAIKNGYPVKHCLYCQRYHKGGCYKDATIQYENKLTGVKKQRPIRLWVSKDNNEKVDCAGSASCSDFIPNQEIIDRIIKYCERIPYWDYKLPECNRK